jgi:uncharacterized protein (TIGR00369 family)
VDPTARLPDTPCNRWLGFQLRERTAQRVELALPARAEFAQEEGVVHGGILTALADTAAVHLIWPHLPAGRGMTGVGLQMNFLGPAMPGGGPLVAVAVPLRIGRTIAVCESAVHQDGRLVAKGTFTFLLRERRPSERRTTSATAARRSL